MRILTGILWFSYKIIVFYTLFVYALTYWTLSAHWLAGFMMLSLEPLLIIHVFFLLLWAVVSPRKALLPLVVLALGFPFLKRTLHIDFNTNSSAENLTSEAPLKVLNYNVFKFNMFDFRDGTDTVPTQEVKRWLTQQNADVLCFQEFYSDRNTPALNFVSLLGKIGYKYQAFQEHENKQDSRYRDGLAVFSKFPIVAHRDTSFGGQNGLIQVDIVWNEKKIRIVDTHLYSMTLKLSRIASQREYEGLKRETKGTFYLMRRGFSERGEQTQDLERWIAGSPYPLIVCGDFNETPYSYVYGRLKKHLANAFETKGSGFGFTYNHLPYFIRIDNQFYDDSTLKLVDFATLNQVPYSDHYPLMGSYVFKKP